MKVALTGVPSATVPVAGVLSNNVGLTGNAVTVNVAGFELVEPNPLVATQRYIKPFRLFVAAVIFNVVVVAPE